MREAVKSGKTSNVEQAPASAGAGLFDQLSISPSGDAWAYKLASAQNAGRQRSAERAAHWPSPELFIDPSSLPPNTPITIARESEYGEHSVTFIQPVGVKELALLHNLTHLRHQALDYVPSQIKFVSYFCSSQESLVLEAKTGSGKTFMSLMCADKYLSTAGDQVIAVTPSGHLVDQFNRDASIVLDLPPESVMLATGDAPPPSRRNQYACNDTKLIIATSETLLNDLLSGAVDLNRVKMIIFDEMHLMRGQHALARLAGLVAEINRTRAPDARIRVLAQSATPGRNKEQIERRMRMVGATDYVPLAIPPNHCFTTIQTVELSGELLQAHNELKEIGRQTLRKLWTELLTVADSFAEAGTPYGPIEALMVEVGAGFSKGGKMRLARFLEARRGLFLGRTSSTSAQKERAREFMMPMSGTLTDILESFDETIAKTDRWYLQPARLLMSQLGHLRHISNVAQTEGLNAFLSGAAGNFARANFTDSPNRLDPWLREIYQLPAMKALLAAAARSTPFADFYDSTSWQEFFARRGLRAPDKGSDHEALCRALVEHSLPLMATRREPDSPAEKAMLTWITGDTRITGGDGVQFRVKEVAHAHFLRARLKYLLSRPGAFYESSLLTGKKHLPGPRREAQLNAYEERLTSAIVATSAGDLGVDAKRTKMVICLAAPDNPNTEEQLRGRAGRRKDLRTVSPATGGAYIIIATKGSEDELRAYACHNSVESARRKREELGEQHGGKL